MSEGKVLLDKKYSWEPSNDIYRDVSETIEEIIETNGGEWLGIVRIVITYDKNNNS